MNWYFWRFWIPLQVITLCMFIGICFNFIIINWWIVGLSWFMIGPVGIGVGYHRLFSHRQFETSKPIEYALAILGTLSAYSPLSFWTASHQHHHKTVDTDKDPASPEHFGFWESVLWYRMREQTLKIIDIRNYCFIRLARDPFLMFVSKYFEIIIWVTMIIMCVIGINWLASVLIIPIFLEHIRINLVNAFGHIDIPGSYRNYDTPDRSQNNFFIGYLSFGFGWHNNHHANPSQLSLHNKWWEFDIEGLLGKLLSSQRK